MSSSRDVLGAAVPVVVRVVVLGRDEAAQEHGEVLEEAALVLVDADRARRVRRVDATDAVADAALAHRFLHLLRDVGHGQAARGPQLRLAMEGLQRAAVRGGVDVGRGRLGRARHRSRALCQPRVVPGAGMHRPATSGTLPGWTVGLCGGSRTGRSAGTEIDASPLRSGSRSERNRGEVNEGNAPRRARPAANPAGSARAKPGRQRIVVREVVSHDRTGRRQDEAVRQENSGGARGGRRCVGGGSRRLRVLDEHGHGLGVGEHGHRQGLAGHQPGTERCLARARWPGADGSVHRDEHRLGRSGPRPVSRSPSRTATAPRGHPSVAAPPRTSR